MVSCAGGAPAASSSPRANSSLRLPSGKRAPAGSRSSAVPSPRRQPLSAAPMPRRAPAPGRTCKAPLAARSRAFRLGLLQRRPTRRRLGRCAVRRSPQAPRALRRRFATLRLAMGRYHLGPRRALPRRRIRADRPRLHGASALWRLRLLRHGRAAGHRRIIDFPTRCHRPGSSHRSAATCAARRRRCAARRPVCGEPPAQRRHVGADMSRTDGARANPAKSQRGPARARDRPSRRHAARRRWSAQTMALRLSTIARSA